MFTEYVWKYHLYMYTSLILQATHEQALCYHVYPLQFKSMSIGNKSVTMEILLKHKFHLMLILLTYIYSQNKAFILTNGTICKVSKQKIGCLRLIFYEPMACCKVTQKWLPYFWKMHTLGQRYQQNISLKSHTLLSLKKSPTLPYFHCCLTLTDINGWSCSIFALVAAFSGYIMSVCLTTSHLPSELISAHLAGENKPGVSLTSFIVVSIHSIS